jgi:nucleotide-binding universal stress UspA family protein
MIRRILVAVADFTANSQPLYEKATILAQATQAELKWLHVITPDEQQKLAPVAVASIASTAASSQKMIESSLWRRFERRCLELLKAYSENARETGINTHYEQVRGVPQEMICQVARQWPADLIIVNQTDLDACAPVDHYLLQHAPCSTLFVKTIG